MGVHDPRTFEFPTPPDTASLVAAFEMLHQLGAVDASMDLTPHGKDMAHLPLDPTYAYLLLQSPRFGCTREMLTAVAHGVVSEKLVINSKQLKFVMSKQTFRIIVLG